MYRFQVAQTPHGEIQDILNLRPGDDESFEIGTVLSRDGNAVIPYDDAVGVYGVAQSPARDGTAIIVGGNQNGVNVAKPHNVKFLGQAWDDGADEGEEIVTLSNALHRGEQYGIILIDTGGPNGPEQFIDINETSDVVLEIVDVKKELNVAIFKFLAEALQEP